MNIAIRWLAASLLLSSVSIAADEAPDADFLEFLGALESEPGWSDFFDGLPPRAAGEIPEPVPGSEDSDEDQD